MKERYIVFIIGQEGETTRLLADLTDEEAVELEKNKNVYLIGLSVLSLKIADFKDVKKAV